MDAIDIILIIIVATAAITGFWHGLVHHIGAIAAVICAIIACRLFGGTATTFLAQNCNVEPTPAQVLAYTAIFILTFIIIKLIARLITKIITAASLRFVDRLAGAVVNVVFWLIITSLIANVWLVIVPEHRQVLAPGNRPWRTAVVDITPRLAGYIATTVDS